MTIRPSAGLTWRVLADTGERDVARNLALDEALARAGGPLPAVRLWRNRRSVIVGRFQLVRAEVDEAACAALEVPIFRRFTGGGAVYHDPGTLCLSVVVSRRDPVVAGDRPIGFPAGLPGIYRLVLEPLAEAARRLGVAAKATEREVVVDGRKVAGVAAWLGAAAVLVHATLLVEADLDALERTLDGPGAPGDPRWERTKSRRVPVTSLERVLRDRPAPVPPAAAVDAAVLDALSTSGRDRQLDPGRISDTEAALAERLLAERYARPAWHATGTN
ncbi:MAG: lipoate--protein ligase family protein [Chloroflexota bacterium]